MRWGGGGDYNIVMWEEGSDNAESWVYITYATLPRGILWNIPRVT